MKKAAAVQNVDMRDVTFYIEMTETYETDSFNLGWRRYEAGRSYRVDEPQLEEIVAAGAGVRFKPEFPPATPNPVRRNESIIPKVTRWISSNGVDTINLNADEPISVPSNLAAYLVSNGLAEAA